MNIIAGTRYRTVVGKLFVMLLLLTSCSKLVSISDPDDRIVTNVAFSTDNLATAAVNGIYNNMMFENGFSRGAATLYGGLSSDELIAFYGPDDPYYTISTNHISLIGGQGSGSSALTDNIWSSAYGVIYTANAVIEGIAASASSQLHDNVRTALTAEARCIRAFCYFYLTNYYGDVPLVLTTDYNAAITLPRAAQADIYQQIIQDLKEAQSSLPGDYAAGKDRRVRVNKWVATALLARVYLFTGDYKNAAQQATEVINNSSLYGLETNLKNVFLTTSREAIWQLNQVTGTGSSDGTPDGLALLPQYADPDNQTAYISYLIAAQLLNAFEPGDLRQQLWTDSTVIYQTGQTAHFSSKYEIGISNQTLGGAPIEYYMVLRLAEQYLIRAEAEANGAGGGPAAAVADLNIIRARAGLPRLPSDLPPATLQAAVAHEWQTEFFCEWGHRWFNLKRTGEGHKVLSQIPLKQPWAGDQQLLYPIPPADIARNRDLSQNPGY